MVALRLQDSQRVQVGVGARLQGTDMGYASGHYKRGSHVSLYVFRGTDRGLQILLLIQGSTPEAYEVLTWFALSGALIIPSRNNPVYTNSSTSNIHNHTNKNSNIVSKVIDPYSAKAY